MTPKVAEALIDTAKEFVQKVVSPPLEEVGGLLADQIRAWRFRNQVNIIIKANEFLKAKNIDPKKISLKTLTPLLEGCSLEDNETLQLKWAALLANTATQGSSLDNTLYSHILGQLSTLDASILDLLYNASTTKHGGNLTVIVQEKRSISLSQIYKDNSESVLSIDNLLRLRLIKEDNPFSNETVNVILTTLGFRFMNACLFN